jgi:hypothetical protein
LSEFTGCEAPDQEATAGEGGFAARQIAACGSGSRSHYRDNIEREAQLVRQLIGESSPHGVHVASGVKNKIVTIA